MFTKQIRKMLTNDKADKLTYEEDSEMFTFVTLTNYSATWIAHHIESALEQYEPELLEFYHSTKSWKPKWVIIKFYLKNKGELENGQGNS